MCLPLSKLFKRFRKVRTTAISKYPFMNTVGPHESGYIKKEELERYLETEFPKEQYPLDPPKESDRFEIRVSI
jgi:hypothetical protein